MCPVRIKWEKRFKKGLLGDRRLFRKSHSLSWQNYIKYLVGRRGGCGRETETRTGFSTESKIVLDHHQKSKWLDQAILERLARKWDIANRNSKHGIAIKVSELYADVLRSLARARVDQKILKDFLQGLSDTKESDAGKLEMMRIFLQRENPFCGKVSEKLEIVVRDYEKMNERLQEQRNIRRTTRFARKLVRVSSVFVVVAGASVLFVPLAGVLMLLTALLAGPLAITIPVQAISIYRLFLKRFRRRRVKKRWRQQQITSLTAFVVKHSLRTMDLLIARLRNDVENIRDQLRFFLQHRDDDKIGLHICEQLQKNQESFTLLLDDLEASILSDWT